MELRLPADIVYQRGVSADSAVTFSHVTHVGFADNRCTGCHPQPFRMLRPTHRANHATMNAGGSCGTCHDGKKAFGVREASQCATCHVGRVSLPVTGRDPSAAGATAASARKLPRPHAYPKAEFSPGRVTFRHETHMKRATASAECHPRPFAMRATAPLADGGMHEKAACGACHDGKSSFATEDQDACNRCHVEAGGTP